MTEIFVGFIDEKTRQEYQKAEKEDAKLFKLLERATDDLKINPEIGIKIPKHLRPRRS